MINKIKTFCTNFFSKRENLVKFAYCCALVFSSVSFGLLFAKLIGGDEVYLLLGGSYQESGYRVSDNYDDVSNIDISVTGNVNTSLEGEYYFTYTARDSSDNVGSVKRKVVVVKSVISTSSDTSGRVSASLSNVSLYTKSVIVGSTCIFSKPVYFSGWFL